MSSNLIATLIATHHVVCLVEGQAQSFMAGEPLPELPEGEAARLVELGAAREAVVEGKAAKAKPKKAKAHADKGADGTADEEGDDATGDGNSEHAGT